jgi:hypothetical protein
MLVGVFIGVLIAFSIVWWQGNDIGNWKLVKKVKSYFSNIFSRNDDNNVTVITEKSNDQNKVSVKQNQNISEFENDSAYYDTTNIDLYDTDALDEFLARYNGQLPDSLVIDSIIKSQNNIDINSYNNMSNVEVRKDRLIYAKSFNVTGIDLFSDDNPDKLDSLLTDNKTAVSGRNKNILLVEFWKSPINYKGYKTGKNKLVIFGIDQYDIISFKVLNNILYMKYMSDFYEINKTVVFKSLIPISNPQLLSQLSK